MKTYKVLFFVSGEDLGTQHPWIPTQDESTFEAHDHHIDAAGTLTLLIDGQPVHEFNGNRWVHVEIVQKIENDHERAPEPPVLADA